MNAIPHTWKDIIEILILTFIIYRMLLFFEGTRAQQVLRGIVILLFGFFLCQRLNLEVLNWLLSKLFAISVISLLIIFQPEIRQGLAKLGQRHVVQGMHLRKEEIDEIIKQLRRATENLAKHKVGALIAIEKNDPLTSYVESGVVMDARVSADLIETIFTPNSLLHDGGLIIQQGRIMAAGCLFPLAQNQDLSRIFGTRHRAALGLGEETDALVIVVSEERQDISLVHNSRLYTDVQSEELFSKLKELFTS